LSGIPVVNVNNACATGSTALFLARQAVESGVVDCALALGFEQMNPGALVPQYRDRMSPLKQAAPGRAACADLERRHRVRPSISAVPGASTPSGTGTKRETSQKSPRKRAGTPPITPLRSFVIH